MIFVLEMFCMYVNVAFTANESVKGTAEELGLRAHDRERGVDGGVPRPARNTSGYESAETPPVSESSTRPPKKYESER